MQSFFNSTVRFGSEPVNVTLRPSGQSGDWTDPLRVGFPRPFGGAIPGRPKDVPATISVVGTVRSGTAAVVVIERVDGAGFTFRARNADPEHPNTVASLDWLAVLDAPDPSGMNDTVDGRLSILQPRAFGGFRDREYWPRIWFSHPMDPGRQGNAAVILTATDLHCRHPPSPATVGRVDELYASAELLKNGIIDGTNVFGFAVHGFDVDTAGGECAFYAAAFTPTPDPDPTDDGATIQRLWFDQGTEMSIDSYSRDAVLSGTPYPIARGGESGDWQTHDVYFDRPFLTPPLVLATARGRTPLVCVARKVTPFGFTLSARNTDTVSGHALFNWVAIGTASAAG
jgi:hypothetical protein